MAASTPATISQEYFDELCLENRDDFELSEDEALQETIQQLSLGGQPLPSHLILTFPTSQEGMREREVNTQIKSCVERIKKAEEDVESLTDALHTLYNLLNEERQGSPRVARFVVYGGFQACMDVMRKQMRDQSARLCPLLLLILQTEQTSPRASNGLDDLQHSFLRTWPSWLTALETESSSAVANWKVDRLNHLLQLANYGVKQSEPNKKAFMATKSTNSLKTSPAILLATLDKLSTCSPDGQEDIHHLVGEPLCRLIATVCTYDDFRMAQGAPTVSSAHANVRSFHQENGVVRIARYLQEKKETSAILALRSLAIHDEIVQAMVAVGVLDTSSALLRRLLKEKVEGSDTEVTLEALTAVIGLFRNVSANDEIKSKLCVGDKSVVLLIVRAMEAYPEAAKLQEHACATFAAMALRSPRNAEYLVKQNDVTTWIVRAMHKHPSRTTVQRQGCLALRNLASRSADLQPIIIQAGAAQALKDIAAKHVSCQDEVYAALRDLGQPASMLRVEQDSSGQLILKQTEMFGNCKSNFRPVFD